jgi:hypothetical protein
MLSFVLTGCGAFRNMASDREHPYFQPLFFQNYGTNSEYPKTFTIYPFKNTSQFANASERARSAIFQTFSLLGSCTSLKATNKLCANIYTSQDALKVAREEGTDAVVIGEVLQQDNIWIGLAEWQVVEVSVRIYATKNGRLIWRGKTMASDYDFGFWVLAIPIFDYAQHGVWSRTTMDLYHRVGIDFVHSIRPNVLPVK